MKIVNTVKSEEATLKKNKEIVRLKYPKYKVEQYRYFSYLFTAIKGRDTLNLRVSRKGLVEQIRF